MPQDNKMLTPPAPSPPSMEVDQDVLMSHIASLNVQIMMQQTQLKNAQKVMGSLQEKIAELTAQLEDKAKP